MKRDIKEPKDSVSKRRSIHGSGIRPIAHGSTMPAFMITYVLSSLTPFYLFRLIISDKTSRNLFLFLILNLSFAFVELFYGWWTNSLGLISDAFHMFFDCTALLAGLAASIITKWKANERFSYGYVRAEVIAGFVNGLFLLFIAFFIFSEAVERAMEPPEVKHERLFIVSVLGFFVNLIGIFAFQHGGQHHGHSHGSSHSHSHSHNNTVTNPLLQSVTLDPHLNNHGNHTHGANNIGNHNHNHSHGGHDGEGAQSQILQGVFLHIMADTLGSVGVIISAILMSQFGWMIADPICSMFIAALIGVSVLPLLRDSIYILMQRTPKQLEKQLPSCYQRIMQLDGVYSVQDTHFWTLCTDIYIGSLKVEVSNKADTRFILSHIQNIFNQIGVRNVYVQIDYSLM